MHISQVVSNKTKRCSVGECLNVEKYIRFYWIYLRKDESKNKAQHACITEKEKYQHTLGQYETLL